VKVYIIAEYNTSAITRSDIQALEAAAKDPRNPGPVTYAYEFGVFVMITEEWEYMIEDWEQMYSPEFLDIYRQAGQMGLRMIRFDEDA
jgi:hypothetical protein